MKQHGINSVKNIKKTKLHRTQKTGKHKISTQNQLTNPIVLSTWDIGYRANKKAWQILSNGGWALDAVEEGVKVTESEINCCVGLGGIPDNQGRVTLDASIMDDNFNNGAVAALERIRHPISVARRVMEKTPHVLLVGEGAQQFALAEGFKLEPANQLSELGATEWEKYKNKQSKSSMFPISKNNHDTIGMVALDMHGKLSGSCTTSGLGFKMHGRVGDSAIIGAGLYVDNNVGAAVATGPGEEIIRFSATATVVEFMRRGKTPQQACEAAIRRLKSVLEKQNRLGDQSIQVGLLAIGSDGNWGAYSLRPNFQFAIRNNIINEVWVSKCLLKK